jgi:multidrug efflux pump subunit AcrB/ABC-type multidrug transport system ATPase subunit
MLFIGLTLLGYISYKNLDLELLPNVELPFLIVQVTGAREMDPEYLEKQAIIPLEGAIGMLDGIEKFESYIERRQGRIMIYYNSDVNIKYAYLKLQEKVDSIKPILPDEFFVLVLKIDTQQLANMFMNLQVRGSGGIDRIRHLFEREIREEFESIDGIANVEVFGGHEKSVEIVLKKEVAEAFNLTPSRIRNLIARNNQEKFFLGRIDAFQKEIHVNLIAEYSDINDLEDIVVDPTVPLLLKDVAEINFDIKEETSISRINGKEAVTVQLVRDTRVNLIELSHLTHAVIERLNKKLKGEDIEIVVQQDSSEFLEKNLDLIKELALIGGLIAILILWFFLKNISLVLVIGLALPISIFSSFNLFYAFGITLNSLTLVGMALAIGMLLDNSIVVLENIYRIYKLKKDALFAVINGVKEIWRSVFAATLTTIIVFLPFIFASNFMVRILGYQIGISIISTLLVSLFVALILIPMIVYTMIDRRQEGNKQFQSVTLGNRLVQIYLLFLKSAMRFPLRTIVSAVVLFFMSLIIALALSLNVQEENQAEDINLYLTMPSGSTLETTDLAVAELEQMLEGINEVEDLICQIYEEEAILTFVLKEDYESIDDNTLVDLKEIVDDRIDEFRIAEVSFEQPASSGRFRGGGGNFSASFERLLGIGGQNEELVIKGSDFEIMRRVADDIQYQLEEISSINRVRINVASSRPEIHLFFDKKLLNEYEITLASLAGELSNFQREVSTGIKFKQDTEEYDILIMDEDPEEKDIEDLRTLPIPSNAGGAYPLDQVSNIIFAEGKTGINRINQERQIEVSYRFINEVTESNSFLEVAREEVRQMLANLELPTGVAVEMVEDEEELEDFYFLIAVAILLIYMILASVFESLLNPFIIMFTIPLAAIGSLWAIIFSGSSLLNANTLIGFLILLGIVVNNGIILIDYTRFLRKNGFRRSRALLAAGKARLRPILITALTTITALIPLALGKVEYVTTIAAPFAITVIGGLSLSTVFTLVLIPTVYSGLENMVEWIKSLDYRIKVIQVLCLIGGSILIYINVESLIWQFANLFVLLLVIPGGTYFILQSLRQARAEFIDREKPITIVIRNLYKIYEQPSRFVREWKNGRLRTEKSGIRNNQQYWTTMLQTSWQYLLLLFLIYFVYFYLRSAFWMFVLVHPLYFYILYLLNKHIDLFKRISALKDNHPPRKILGKINQFIFWGLPVLNLLVFYIKWQGLVLTVIIGIIWYFALTVYTTSNRLTRNLVDVNRIKGRFAKLRKRFYRLIQLIPLIGKKTKPFKALNGISLEIGHGMFGLLGPNGAGKTTLMRIICGILEQNYGTIRMNGIDVTDKREELQGLIGYLPQDFGTYENLTAYEFLNYQAILKNIGNYEAREKRINYVLSAVHMEKHSKEKIGSFSGGMKQRIGIAQTLLHLPRILVVDEPTAGLDPRERIRFRNLLVELSRDRIVLFSTHIIEDVASSCQKVAVLNHGQVKYIGAPVKMAESAHGHVWQCKIDAERFEQIRNQHKVVHHITIENSIRIRILSEEKPLAEAVAVSPTLEDAYLWLLEDRGL